MVGTGRFELPTCRLGGGRSIHLSYVPTATFPILDGRIVERPVVKKFLQHVVPGVVKPIRVLWNEVIGFVFLAFALWTIPSTYRHIRDFNGDPDSFFRLILSSVFALIMVFFGVGSFLRARKISRS